MLTHLRNIDFSTKLQNSLHFDTFDIWSSKREWKKWSVLEMKCVWCEACNKLLHNNPTYKVLLPIYRKLAWDHLLVCGNFQFVIESTNHFLNIDS